MSDTFTPAEFEVLLLAWAANEKGKAFRPDDELWPECHRLAERRWLERRWNDQNGELVFRWSPQADTSRSPSAG